MTRRLFFGAGCMQGDHGPEQLVPAGLTVARLNSREYWEPWCPVVQLPLVGVLKVVGLKCEASDETDWLRLVVWSEREDNGSKKNWSINLIWVESTTGLVDAVASVTCPGSTDVWELVVGTSAQVCTRPMKPYIAAVTCDTGRLPTNMQLTVATWDCVHLLLSGARIGLNVSTE